ncbi:replication factor C subunit 3-like isoform X1 [Zingiber officinale]|uniref:replication factor C subunit 3-like isoform X1 n=1 Tax=Zingiber officinale TaxID=94328 RepID=UPI001C4CA961|nr:replication factor C subunit 3-like isoform X1 [Zingiber officinale]
MNTLVDTIRRFSSEPVIASSSELGSLLFEVSAARSSFLSEERFLRKHPVIHLLSLGFSPGRRQDLPGSGSAVPASAASTVDIQRLGLSFFFDRCSGGASLLLDSSPTANLLGLAPVPKFSMRGEESGSKADTDSTSPGRKSLMESELVLPRSDDSNGPAYAIASSGNKDTAKMTAARSTGSVEEKRYVWADKYRPNILTKFICNKDKALELHQMVSSGKGSHLIFEGPPGVGKKTMILATLREMFGSENVKVKMELRKFELKGEFVSSIEISMGTSSRHVEVNLSDMHGYEKYVLVTLINESHISSEKHVICDGRNCRVIVIHDADNLSTDAQHYVSWLMEKYQGCNKIFFCCSEASKLHIIEPLCKTVKLQPPSDDEVIKHVFQIVQVLEFIGNQESIYLPKHMSKIIAENSKNNLRQAIRSFEASWKSNYSLKENKDILTGWEDVIAGIAKSLIKEQSPKQLYIIRGKLKNLIEHDVSPDFIFSTLFEELKKHLDERLKAKAEFLYHKYQNQQDSDKWNDSKKNLRYFMRIEEFTAHFMSLYKSFITKTDTEPKH